MIKTITQETIRVILPSKVAQAVEEIARRNGTDPAEELPRFYASAVYRALETRRAISGGSPRRSFATCTMKKLRHGRNPHAERNHTMTHAMKSIFAFAAFASVATHTAPPAFTVQPKEMAAGAGLDGPRPEEASAEADAGTGEVGSQMWNVAS